MMTPSNTKPLLRFSEKGTFRILMMSDIQESAHYRPDSLASVRALLDAAAPDLVLWGGDNCYGPAMHSLEDVDAFLAVFAGEMERRGIPWAHVFGNHDHDVPCDPLAHQALYERFPHCVSAHTEGIHGVTNFCLPVYAHSGSEVRFRVWGLDTNRRPDELNGRVPSGNLRAEACLPNNPLGAGDWGFLYFDQLMWYWNTSCRAEEEDGRIVPGLLCMHMAPHEFITAVQNPAQCVKSGHYGETLNTHPLNSGLFAAILQRGDIRTISCGHTHENDAEAEYCGIKLCWDACAGFGCYGHDELRGGRLFVVHEEDPRQVETKMLHTLDLLREASGRQHD